MRRPHDGKAVAAALAPEGLAVMGGFHPAPGDGAPQGTGTLLLVGPQPPRFWTRFAASAERRDGLADPLDRWSARVLGRVAAALGAAALFPFGGPPHHPFIRWAERTGRAFRSPVGLLVHARLGLFVSFRGALAFAETLPVPEPVPPPCAACAGPCRDACPAGALGPAGYDVAACRAFVASAAGCACRGQGCAVRRACPVGAAARHGPAQAAFHMAAFLGEEDATPAGGAR